MLTPEDSAKFEDLIKHLKTERNVSILVGAGISVSSRVPTSAGIVRILKRLGFIDKHAEYATAMEKAFDNGRQRRTFLERLFLGKPPSQEHYSLAHLVEKQVLKTIFTTNFDHLTEIALSQLCSYSVHSYLTREGLESIDERIHVARIIKLHGDFLFSSLANTDEEMGHAVTDSMRSKFANLLQRGSLVVLGYAGDSSILKVLSELAEIPEILSKGVWWILHCPRAKEQPSPGTREAPTHVDGFLSAIQATGKKTTLIKNSLGAQWLLDEICRRITGEIPVKPKFGLGRTQALAPQIGWSTNPAPLPGSVSPIGQLLDRLKQQIKSPGLILIKDPNDEGKTALVAALISETRERPCFYFSFAFARNNPEDSYFLAALGDFLDAKGLLTENFHKRFWVEVLLEQDGIIVLDDLPISLDKTRRTVEPGTCRASFIKVFYPALSVLKKLSKGNLIVCLPDSMPAGWQGDFLNVGSIVPDLEVTEISLPEKQNHKFSAHSIFKSLNSTERRVLLAMAALRFAESADFIAKIANTHDSVSDALHHLVQLGVAKSYGGKFLIRTPPRIQLLRHIHNTWPTPKIVDTSIHLARSYEKFSDDPECLAPRHCLLEAENAYYEASVGFRADKWAAGMKALVQTSLALAHSPLSRDFILETLKSYFRAAGDIIFSGLDLRDLATLFSTFALVSGPKDDEFNALVQSFLASLKKRNELLPAWLTAVAVLSRNGYMSPEGSAALLGVKEEMRLNKRKKRLHQEEWELLGRCYLGLNRCFGILYRGTQRKELLNRAVRYARLGHLCFERARNEIGKNDAVRFLGVTYMNSGDYRNARKTLTPLFRKEMAQAGFDAFKAAGLNNLFCTYLGVGALRLAEGFFWEANYQYAHSNRRQFMGPLLAIAALLYPGNPASRVFKLHPELQEALPSPETMLDKLIPMWDGLERADKDENFLHVSQAALIISQWFEEHEQLSKEMQTLSFLVRIHEECFAQRDQETNLSQPRQELVLNQLKTHLVRCVTARRLQASRIVEILGPINTEAMENMMESVARSA